MARSLRALPPVALDEDLRAVVQAQADLSHAITRLVARAEAERTRERAPSGLGRLMSVRQVMAETTLSRGRISVLRASGRLAFRRLDGRLVIERVELERFLDGLPTEREA